MKLIRSINWKMMSGPFFFLPDGVFAERNISSSCGICCRDGGMDGGVVDFPADSIYVTAFVPIVVNSVFNLILHVRFQSGTD